MAIDKLKNTQMNYRYTSNKLSELGKPQYFFARYRETRGRLQEIVGEQASSG